MNRIRGFASDALILMLPSLVLLAGAEGAIRLDAGEAAFSMWLILAASAGPLLCGLSLRVALPRADLRLVAACGMLTSISSVSMLYLAQLAGATQPFFQEIASRHLAFVVGAFIALFVGSAFSTFVSLALRYQYVTAAAALALVASTMVIGTTVNGAKLWIVIGPLRVQPAELARVLLALFVAAYLYDRRNLIGTSWNLGELALPPIPYLIPVAGALGIALAALVIQNDLGMAALTAIAAFAMIAQSLRSRWAVVVIGLVVAGVIWATSTVSPRVQSRVGSWLDPWQAPAGAGYQFVQGEYALALGGVGGGGRTADVRAVPEVHTDFIMTAIGAQFGLMVLAAVLALLTIVVVRCARNAMMAPTELESHLAVALTVLLGLQVLLILGGVFRLVPLTGVTLPLVSYGGTSMLVTGFSIGIVVGIGARGAQASYVRS